MNRHRISGGWRRSSIGFKSRPSRGRRRWPGSAAGSTARWAWPTICKPRPSVWAWPGCTACAGAKRHSRRRSVLDSTGALPTDCGNPPGARIDRGHVAALNARIRDGTIAVSPGLAGRAPHPHAFTLRFTSPVSECRRAMRVNLRLKRLGRVSKYGWPLLYAISWRSSISSTCYRMCLPPRWRGGASRRAGSVCPGGLAWVWQGRVGPSDHGVSAASGGIGPAGAAAKGRLSRGGWWRTA